MNLPVRSCKQPLQATPASCHVITTLALKGLKTCLYLNEKKKKKFVKLLYQILYLL